MRRLSLLLLSCFFPPTTQATSLSLFSSSGQVDFAASMETDFPLWLGLSADAHFAKQYSIDIGFGWAPPPYASVIGKAAAGFGGEDAYEPMIEQLLSTNVAFRIGFRYFIEEKSGWNFGVRQWIHIAQGSENIPTVLELVTGHDFSTLKTLLTQAGRDLSMNASGLILTLGLTGGYTWNPSKDWTLDANLGIAKIIYSDISLSTDAPIFNQTIAGQTLMRDAASDLEDILWEYGISPTLSTKIQYTF